MMHSVRILLPASQAMRPSFKLVLIGLLLLQTAGCLVPVRRTAPLVLDAQVEVLDASGNSLSAARVEMIRHEWRGPSRSWAELTDSKGIAVFAYSEEREWVFPFWMHGVPFYTWAVCVSREGYRSQWETWRSSRGAQTARERRAEQREDRWIVRVELVEGASEPCAK
jgi:hypothetical protein